MRTSMNVLPGYVEVQENDNEIVLHSFLSGETIKITDEKYINEYMEIKNGNTENTLYNILSEKMFVTDLNKFNEASVQMRNYMSKRLILSILPTEGCNFRCTYCYENHENIIMTENIIEEIKKYIYSQKNIITKMHIGWFGGEPTLVPQIVLDITGYAKQIAEENNIEFSAAMTTNGYLLNADAFQKFYNVGIKSYQITLDGFEHDNKRILSNGSPTRQVIEKNLTDISKLPQKYEFNITLRRNILENESLEWYKYIGEKWGNDDRFSLLIKIVGNYGGDEVQKLSLIKDKENLILHENYAQKYIRLMNAEQQYIPFSEMCYAAFPKGIVIRADGTLQKCTVALDKEYNTIGHIETGKGFVIDESKNEKWTSWNVTEKCLSCKSAVSCNNLKCPDKNFETLQDVCC